VAKDINNDVFDECSRLKLDIFGDCFKEWFPVFLHDQLTEEIVIFDFFAGSGADVNGVYGSPLVLLKNARGENMQFCQKVNKSIRFIFNEFEKQKTKTLENTVLDFKNKCREETGCSGQCPYTVDITQFDFKELFSRSEIQQILTDRKIGKFVLLDQ